MGHRFVAALWLALGLAFMLPGVWLGVIAAQTGRLDMAPALAIFLALFTLAAFSTVVHSAIQVVRGARQETNEA